MLIEDKTQRTEDRRAKEKLFQRQYVLAQLKYASSTFLQSFIALLVLAALVALCVFGIGKVWVWVRYLIDLVPSPAK
jgi:hypothetical protein